MDNQKDTSPLTMLDPYKVWKKLYFSNEQVWTSAMRDFVNTDLFANSIDLILNSYLQYLRFQNEIVSRYMEESPLASKRDMARVAELVVSLENKVDGIELNVEDRLDDVDAGLNALKENTSPDVLLQRINNLEKLIKNIDANLTALNKQLSVTTRSRAAAKKDSPPKTDTN